MKRTLERELKVPEIAEREAKETSAVPVHLFALTESDIVRRRESGSLTSAGDRLVLVEPSLCRASE